MRELHTHTGTHICLLTCRSVVKMYLELSVLVEYYI